MPNIIEQQDLLKGLPDNRLALLLQNPVADIPPFLVAAEAQRRQAIRQQFSGMAPKESVVDSLTKQLAGVPQNLQTQAQMPPVIPPTPQMAGVAALQQQAMAPQQQMMRGGGRVRRFQFGGFVPANVPSTSTRVKDIADQFGVTVEEAAEMIRNNPNIGQKPEDQFGYPDPILETNKEPDADPMTLDLPGITTSLDEYNKKLAEQFRENKYNEMDNYGGYTGTFRQNSGMTPQEIAAERALMASRVKSMQNPEPLVGDVEQQPGETDDEFRARIAALFDDRGPSDWEKANRWFMMAEQFLDPEKTTMQSVAGAGRAFSEGSSALANAERQAQIEKERALLEYDLSERNRVLDAEQKRAEREYQSELKRQERQTLGAGDAVTGLNATLKVLNDQIASIDEDYSLKPEEKEKLKEPIRAQIQNVYISLAQIMRSSGYGIGNVITEDQLRAQIAKP